MNVPFAVGAGGGGNTADGSTGAVQVGGGQVGGGTGGGSTVVPSPASTALPGSDVLRTLAAAVTGLGLPTAAAQSPAGSNLQAAGTSPASAALQNRLAAQPVAQRSHLAGQGAAAAAPASRSVAQAVRQVVARGVLPFTGRSLLLWAAIGLAAGLLGLGVRARALP